MIVNVKIKNTISKCKLLKIVTVLLVILIAGMQKIYGQTELYKQYQHRKDMMVVCVMDFPVAENVKVDITMLVPNNKEAVYTLVEEFNLDLDKDTVYNRFGKEDRYTLYTYNVRKDNIKKMFVDIKSDEDYKEIAKLVYNYNNGVIMIFHDIETKEREHQIMVFLFGSTINPDILPKVNKDK